MNNDRAPAIITLAMKQLDDRVKVMRDNCGHVNRLKGLPSSTFEVAQMCLDCGQFFEVWSINGEHHERAAPTNVYYVHIAASKLHYLAESLDYLERTKKNESTSVS